MRALTIVILLFLFTGCQTGLLPCPKPKQNRLKRVFARQPKTDRNSFTASIRNIEPKRKPDPSRPAESPAPLEHLNVEEWDCPKPGVKRAVPKAVKDNIRKNKRAYETFYKSRNGADSVRSHSSSDR